MADSDEVKAALTALAEGQVDSKTDSEPIQLASKADSDVAQPAPADMDGDADYQTVIEQATQAIDDLDAAVAFVDTFGIGQLETAVAQAEHEVSGLADEGRVALDAFWRYRDAAAGAGDGS